METLGVFINHHLWATRYLIAHCQTLAQEQLSLSLPGTYGQILPTLVHLVAEDQRLLERLSGEPARVPVAEDDAIGLAELLRVFEASAESWVTVALRADSIDITLPARGRWPEVPQARDLVLLEAVQHGNDHRTQVCAVLGAHDLEVPFLCGWKFWMSTRDIAPLS